MTADRKGQGVTINKELLALAATAKGGYTQTQLEALGVTWPPPKGWTRAAVGRRISRSSFDVLMSEAAHGLRRLAER